MVVGALKVKEVKCVVTQGVNSLELPRKLLTSLFDTAIRRYSESKGEEYMTTFNPDGINIVIGDGNDTVATDINYMGLRETLWVMIDDYGSYFVATLLLPSEY